MGERRRRVPLVRQTGPTECAAACLAMILGYHGRETSLRECTDRMGAGRDGATARTLAEAARSFGLHAQGYSIEPEHLAGLDLPIVAHWDFSHFVVVERCRRGHVEVADPASGRRRYTLEEVDAHLTGVAVGFAPGPDFEARRERGSHPWLRYAAGLVTLPGTRAVLAQVLLASLLLQLFGLAVPLTTKVVVDRVLPDGLSDALSLLALGIVVWVAALAAVGYLRSTLLVHLQARLDSRMMVGFFEHLLRLPYAFFQRRAAGDLMMRVASNSLIRELLTNQSLSLVLDGSFAIVYLTLLFVVSPPFGWLVAAIAAVQGGVLWLTTRPMHELMQRDVLADSAQQSYLVEALKGIATLKAAGAEPRTLERWSHLFHRYLDAALRRNRFAAGVETALTAVRTLAPLALLWFGAREVLAGDLSLGTMLALVALAGSFLGPLAALTAGGRQLQTVGVHLQRIGDVLDRAPEQEEPRRPVDRLAGRIEVDGVSFRYAADGLWVLRDVSFAVPAGGTVAFVGPSGSGKSTLAALLLGLYRPSEGEIRYDGTPLDRLDLRSLRARVGSVLQESYLFGGSLRSNVAFNDPTLPFERVVEAARLAVIDEEIERFAMGYESLVQEGGGTLSGGERQRLSIARAVATRPAVLVLDEATSHLDSATEDRVAANLATLRSTQVLIAHRLSTIRHADQILVFERGAVAERGRHRELMAAGGLYRSMVDAQQADHEGEEEDEKRASV